MNTAYRPRWPLLIALIGGVALVLTMAYLPARRSGQAGPQRAGYIEGVAGAPATVNPLFAGLNQTDSDLSSLVFSSLVRLGRNGFVEPALAEVPKVTPEGSTYIFQLRSGLTWHDGQPLTAKDVVFTIGLTQDPGFAGDPGLRDLFRGVRVEAPETMTVTITLPAPFAPFLARLAGVGILPEHLLRGVAAADLANAPFNQHPVGSGPYRLIELSQQHAVLVPFSGYYLGQPHIPRLELRFYRDDTAVLAALRSGEADGAFFRQPLLPADLAAIIADGRWKSYALHGPAYSLVYLNQQRAQPLGDGRVRAALQHALDRQTLIQNALGGQALTQDGPIARDMWTFTVDPAPYAFDSKDAAALLDSAGWTLQNGVRTKDGLPLRFALATSDDPAQLAVAQEIARQWARLGATVTVQPSAAGTYVDNVLLPRSFDAALVSIDPGPDPDPYPFWHSTQTIGTGRNLAGFIDATVDGLLEDGRTTIALYERIIDYNKFEQAFAGQLPALPLYTATSQFVVPTKIKGLNSGLLITSGARFIDVQEWYRESD